MFSHKPNRRVQLALSSSCPAAPSSYVISTVLDPMRSDRIGLDPTARSICRRVCPPYALSQWPQRGPEAPSKGRVTRRLAQQRVRLDVNVNLDLDPDLLEHDTSAQLSGRCD